jgi:hypothetical protein
MPSFYDISCSPLYARPITNMTYDWSHIDLGTLSFDVRCKPEEIEEIEKFKKLFDEQMLGITNRNIKNTKETNKMEAKKCDRCGKLYEKKFDKNDIQCVFKHEEPFSTGEEKNYSKEFIEDKKTHNVYIKRFNGDCIDMCPDCRKAFKTWFESADKEGKKNG